MMYRSLMLASFVLTNVVSTGSLVERQEDICTVTQFDRIAAAVEACTDIKLRDIAAPENGMIDLSKLKDNTKVTFQGITSFAFTNSSTFIPIFISGKSVKITCDPGAIINGTGQPYWDGLGSNGGFPKPNTFINMTFMTDNSEFSDCTIVDWPNHLFKVVASSDLVLRDLTLDNRNGDAPNERSEGKPAAHNSDGFGVMTSSNIVIRDSRIYNQDDCVAITSGNNITVDRLFCVGGNGLSIGSVGGKPDNNVTNVVFKNSMVLDSSNGARIKTNFNTTGFISNITYDNIVLSEIRKFGIIVRQDYLNGGPTGTATNGVIVENVLFKNIVGTARADGGANYKVFCGDGSCSNFVFENVHVSGGGNESICNFPATGCPA
ncbi:hypothetical protein HYFRA_00008691 [Hymenoscyphus fraxineus]|uniref:endo-polygalacturonase n=1 Tax=Hymenoscyphus fraxineus TaxID=746836 RepID=A0A9N9L0V3_9HELO|nr:hypothetical protein HYFRA_00008691 [Hymenoscyphus fraxineus]